ncbi:hypothetical protein NHX12_022473 [Muraenolepis orangiensis]|uniref:TSG101 and ALIX binding domain-containing protein n=1 Tax=Muraenolepis orangiensis TaxID=630683 RepID=A0A9Q0ER31_9TELE|nr:hypothetical protein NHX12_022473 [Muraenolepis orangiensis]
MEVDQLREENASLRRSLDQLTRHDQHRLQAETAEVKNKLVTMSTRCQDLKKSVQGVQDGDSGGSTTSAAAVHVQLRDAVEKNRQWLAYDQQREHYVKGVMERLAQQEYQLNQANRAPPQRHNEIHSDESERMGQRQQHYDRLLLQAKTELDALREELDFAHNGQNSLQWRCQLHAERLRRQEEKSMFRAQAKDLRDRLVDQEHGGAELLKQRPQQDAGGLDTPTTSKASPDTSGDHRGLSSPSSPGALNESLLDCPGCGAQYPLSRHRELLVHVEHCLD